MHSTLTLFSKALRFPLTSKRGNKDFYKGTRAGNILRRKRLGAVSRLGQVLKDVTPSGRVVDRVEYRRVMHIDETKVPSFIVPPGLADTPVSGSWREHTCTRTLLISPAYPELIPLAPAQALRPRDEQARIAHRHAAASPWLLLAAARPGQLHGPAKGTLGAGARAHAGQQGRCAGQHGASARAL